MSVSPRLQTSFSAILRNLRRVTLPERIFGKAAAASTQDYESGVAIINGLTDVLKTGYQNPEGVRGSIKFEIPECSELNFIVRFDDKLHVERSAVECETDTTISMPIATLQKVARESEFIDWRDPEVIGTIAFSGNLGYANHLGRCFLRPSRRVVARFENVLKFHESRSYKNLDKVEYLTNPTQMQVLEAMEESRPIVIKGLTSISHGENWTIDKLAAKFGDAIVRVRSSTHSQSMREFAQELTEFEKKPYDEIIEGFVKPYTEGAPLPDEMMEDFGPLIFDREDFNPPQLWLGSVPTHIPTSTLHRDPLDGFLLQVMGRKKLDLYSADQSHLLYPHKSYNNYQPCWFKPDKPDFDIYPKAKEAKSISVTLNPGELLMQPAGWFHQVYALDSPNMSVSYFWNY